MTDIHNEMSLGPKELDRLFRRLDEVLTQQGKSVVLYVVGGANMSLAINSRRSTTDVDSVVKQGFDDVFEAAAEVARTEPGLGADWLNADFTGGTPDGGIAWSFMDNAEDDEPRTLMQGRGLTVELASSEMMLALKTLAARDKDLVDIYDLMRHTGIRTPDGLTKNLSRFSGERLFQQQGAPWMPHHIDPSQRLVFDNAPDDLRLPSLSESRAAQRNERKLTKLQAKQERLLAPRCGKFKMKLRDGVEVSRTKPCQRPHGHSGKCSSFRKS